MLAGLDRIVLSRQTECVPSHRMDHIVALHHLVAAPRVGNDIASPVSDMQSVSGRIRKHIEAVVFLLVALDIDRMFFPVAAPFFLYRAMVIGYSHIIFLQQSLFCLS